MATTNVIDEIKKRAPEVAAAHATYLRALLADRDAHADLLSEVVRVVTPALPALASRVISRCEISSAGTTTADAGWRGVPLVTDTGEPFGKPRAERGADPARGRFAGRTLFLASDGKLMEMEYEGTWTIVEGELSRWYTTARGKTPVMVVSEWDVDAVLDRIAAVLRQQTTGAKEERTKAMIARADRIQALVTLARSL